MSLIETLIHRKEGLRDKLKRLQRSVDDNKEWNVNAEEAIEDAKTEMKDIDFVLKNFGKKEVTE